MASEVYSSRDLLAGGACFKQLSPSARLAVLGYPVAHSASPLLHNAALQEANLFLQYVRIEVTPDELPMALNALRQTEFIGVNLTIPHKQKALTLVDQISDHAKILGAINTIVIRDGKLYGHNTDGPGFIAAIKETWGMPLASQRILILGASGGAGRAIAAQCALEGCRQLYLASRQNLSSNSKFSQLQEQAHFLSKLLHQKSAHSNVEIISLEPSALKDIMPHVDLIINATPVGMHPNDSSLIPSEFFQPHQFLYDTIYSGGTTALVQSALKSGVHAANGFSMLKYQAALAFKIWFGDNNNHKEEEGRKK